MYKWAIFFVMPLSILFGVLFGGSSVSASSPYDNTVNITDKLTIKSPDGSKVNDITTSWGGLSIGQPCYDDLQDAIFYGSYAVTNEINQYDNDAAVTIIYSITPANANFFGTSPNTYLQADGVTGYAHITLQNDGSEIFTCGSPYVSGYIAREYNSSYYKIFTFLSTFSITYPTGYEGDEIPDSYTPPQPPLDWSPDMNVINIVDWKITLQDKNFNTFDNVPFTCSEGLTPVIEYSLFNNDTNERIDEGVFSPTVQYEFQSEKYGVQTEYKFIGIYYCGDGDDDPTFSYQTTFYFKSSAAGMYVSEIMTGCITESFPWIDVENCLNNMADAVGLLSFNKLRLPGSSGGGGGWAVSQSCYTMQVLDDWINSPNQQLCPQFPQYIRDAVTPFVTFSLGLFMVAFMVRQTGGGFNG